MAADHHYENSFPAPHLSVFQEDRVARMEEGSDGRFKFVFLDSDNHHLFVLISDSACRTAFDNALRRAIAQCSGKMPEDAVYLEVDNKEILFTKRGLIELLDWWCFLKMEPNWKPLETAYCYFVLGKLRTTLPPQYQRFLPN